MSGNYGDADTFVGDLHSERPGYVATITQKLSEPHPQTRDEALELLARLPGSPELVRALDQAGEQGRLSPSERAEVLREVVFEKMLAAIVDGTLEPGERLNDDQLVKWLGVSRTPVREAIAQLQTYGLVDIEANRFTRIAARDDIVYAEAAQFLAGLHTLAREWASGNIDAATRKTLLGSIASVKKQLMAHDLAGPGALLDVQGELAKASGNALFVGTEEPLRIRVNFLRPREVDSYVWDALLAVTDELAEALNS